MLATLDSAALRGLTRALTCLSKYGEDLIIAASPEALSFSVTSSSRSAYCRFKFHRQFFSRYKFDNANSITQNEDSDMHPIISGQLLTKSFLSILKHRAVEKTVNSCELVFSDGANPGQADNEEEDEDSLESRLIVRLHCKHGVIKTHRLVLLATTTPLMAPNIPDSLEESRLVIKPQAIKDIVDHFPPLKGSKLDPELVWNFGVSDIQVKSLDSSAGRTNLSTELTISTDEFDEYDLHMMPTIFAFQLREFIATTTYAEATAIPLEIRFTEPAAPLIITLTDDFYSVLIAISTKDAANDGFSEARRADSAALTTDQLSKGKKRVREEDGTTDASNSGNNSRAGSRPIERRIPMKAVQFVESGRDDDGGRISSVRPRQSLAPRSSGRAISLQAAEAGPSRAKDKYPLFLPGSQLSQAEQQVLQDAGLGDMTAEEVDELFAADVDIDFDERASDVEHHPVDGNGEDSLDIIEELQPTQYDGGTKEFRPLFED